MTAFLLAVAPPLLVLVFQTGRWWEARGYTDQGLARRVRERKRLGGERRHGPRAWGSNPTEEERR